MLKSCVYIGIIYILLGEKIKTLSTCPHEFLNSKLKACFHSFGNFRHFAAKMIHDSILQLCTSSFSEAQIHS